MRCATCGERLGPGEERCPTCGAVVATGYTRRMDAVEMRGGSNLERCPRCGYQGQGVSYFSRTGHVGLLIGVSVFTYGIGGLVYWLSRRKHRVCASCGLGWDSTQRAIGSGSSDLSQPDPILPSSGIKRRFIGSAMILFASFMILMGLIEAEAAMMAVGSVIGAGGSGSFFWGWQALQERRQALQTGLQRKVLQLAERRGGSLTVTEVAADLNLSLPAAEKVLIAMDDGFRVRSEITDQGILLYEFPEVRHRDLLGPGA